MGFQWYESGISETISIDRAVRVAFDSRCAVFAEWRVFTSNSQLEPSKNTDSRRCGSVCIVSNDYTTDAADNECTDLNLLAATCISAI